MPEPKAVCQYTGDVNAALEFLKRTRWELRELRLARVYRDRLVVIDVNRDSFEIRGVGYADPAAAVLLRAVNAAFDPTTLAEPTQQDYKEYTTGRRHAWAEDRVM
ncbi:MAG: hypothetical protein RMJ88_16035 [Thermogemmata sp.]|nr:hypothetical protein [Thermogemmata sp.]